MPHFNVWNIWCAAGMMSAALIAGPPSLCAGEPAAGAVATAPEVASDLRTDLTDLLYDESPGETLVARGECRPICPPRPSACPPENLYRQTDPENLFQEQDAPQGAPPPPATATPPTSAPFTAASSSDVAAPNMIGDSFGPCSSFVAGSNFSSVAIPICIGASSFRVADNQSPLPQQRLYFNFSHFDDAIEIRKVQGNFGFPLTGETRKSLDVNRSLLGGEFLMLDGMASFQVQLPILNTIDSSTGPFVSSPFNGVPGARDSQLGNIALALKVLAYRDARSAMSFGLGVDLPTGDDVTVVRDVVPGTRFDTLHVENENVTLSPFIGYLIRPSDRLFVQGFAQLAVPLNGNEYNYVSRNHFGTGVIVRENGELDDQTRLHLDVGAGYWLYRDQYAVSLVRGIAPMIELHYTASLEEGDGVLLTDPTPNISGPGIVPGNLGSIGTFGHYNILNLTLATEVLLGNCSALRPAVVLPLRDGDDKSFDYELTVQWNWFF